MLLRGSDSIRYGPLKVELANYMTKGTDNFPKTLVEAMCLLNDYKVAIRPQRAHDNPGEGMAFAQDRGGSCRGGGSGGRAVACNTDNTNCWHCNKLGHHMNWCPDLVVKGIDNLNVEEFNDAHTLFSAKAGRNFEKCMESQECGFAQ